MIQTIDVFDLKKKLDHATEKIVLIDVRTHGEREEGYISNSIHIPLNELYERMSELSSFGTLYFYCKVGGRSHMAAQLFEEDDLPESINVIGGVAAWTLAGYPLST